MTLMRTVNDELVNPAYYPEPSRRMTMSGRVKL